jgi:hypothetical protein
MDAETTQAIAALHLLAYDELRVLVKRGVVADVTARELVTEAMQRRKAQIAALGLDEGAVRFAMANVKAAKAAT